MGNQKDLDRKKTVIKLFMALWLVATMAASAAMANSGPAYINLDFKPVTKSQKKYLIILVHGINTTRAVFLGNGENGSQLDPNDEKYSYGDLKGYLEGPLGLKGYVYAYTFSERDGQIDLEGQELGQRDHFNEASTKGGRLNYMHADHKQLPWKVTKIQPYGSGNSWFKQARQDFIDWFKTEGPGKDRTIKDPLPDEIPNKYIIIAHSMGGLAAREYIFSDYYNNDVAALITIDSQHLGSDGALALKRMHEFYKDHKDIEAIAQLIGISFSALVTRRLTGIDNFKWVAIYSGMCAPLMSAGRDVTDKLIVKGMLGWYPDQPGVQDMDPESSFFADLNSKSLVKGNAPIKARFITGGGIPTPSGDLPANRYALGLETLQTVLSSPYINELPLGSKLMAIYMSVALGAIINQNGDLYARVASQRGDGLTALSQSNVDYQEFNHKFGNDSQVMADVFMGIFAGMAVVDGVSFLMDPFTEAFAKLAIIVYGGVNASTIWQDRLNNFLMGHGIILRKTYEEHLIDQALDGRIPVGGRGPAAAVKSNISASSVNTPTAGFPAPEQAFVLLSDLDSSKKSTGVYHTVTIEAVTVDSGQSTVNSFPIEVNGVKQWVSSITVKEAPTAIKGVINTFLPKKLKKFNYSENFAAWRPVGAVDEWGNFTIKDLKLAEGQNVVAFDAESWIGNKNNQHLWG